MKQPTIIAKNKNDDFNNNNDKRHYCLKAKVFTAFLSLRLK